MLPRSKALAVAILVLVPACTRANPAFGDERTGTGETKDPADDDDDDSVSADDDDDDDGETTFVRDLGEGEAGSITATSAESASTSTTGIVDCNLQAPVLFDVAAFDAMNDEIPPVCDDTSSWIGSTITSIVPGELVVSECGGLCDCDAEAATTHLLFSDLLPSPTDVLLGDEIECRTQV